MVFINKLQTFCDDDDTDWIVALVATGGTIGTGGTGGTGGEGVTDDDDVPAVAPVACRFVILSWMASGARL